MKSGKRIVKPVARCEKCGGYVDRVLSIFRNCETHKYVWLPVDTCTKCGDQIIRDA